MYDLNEKYSKEMTNVLTSISILKFTILFLQYFTICVYIFNNCFDELSIGVWFQFLHIRQQEN